MIRYVSLSEGKVFARNPESFDLLENSRCFHLPFIRGFYVDCPVELREQSANHRQNVTPIDTIVDAPMKSQNNPIYFQHFPILSQIFSFFFPFSWLNLPSFSMNPWFMAPHLAVLQKLIDSGDVSGKAGAPPGVVGTQTPAQWTTNKQTWEKKPMVWWWNPIFVVDVVSVVVVDDDDDDDNDDDDDEDDAWPLNYMWNTMYFWNLILMKVLYSCWSCCTNTNAYCTINTWEKTHSL